MRRPILLGDVVAVLANDAMQAPYAAHLYGFGVSLRGLVLLGDVDGVVALIALIDLVSTRLRGRTDSA